MVGAVLSMLMLETMNDALLPARSIAVPVTCCPAPSLNIVGLETLNSPDSASPPAKLTVTFALYQLLGFALRSGEPVMFGAVLSMFTPETVAVDVLPARSVTLKVCD